MMKFGIVVFPGTTGTQDIANTIEEALGQKCVFLWHEDADLQNVNGIIIAGGASFGDAPEPGVLAAKSPIMKAIDDFADKGGFVLGIGNGFQLLCESRLLPGTLLPNIHGRFVCKNCYIKADNSKTALTTLIDKDMPLNIPVAHGQGRYFADKETLSLMRQNYQILFRYCDADGKVKESANPDGSLENIAGVCNIKRNIYGIMPHPERATDDLTGNMDGLIIWESVLSYIR